MREQVSDSLYFQKLLQDITNGYEKIVIQVPEKRLIFYPSVSQSLQLSKITTRIPKLLSMSSTLIFEGYLDKNREDTYL